jgi:hypothetical protein
MIFYYNTISIKLHFLPVLVKGLYQTESYRLHVMQLIRIYTTVMEYLSNKWSRISSTLRNNFPALSSFMTYYRVCNQINTTGATTGAGNTYPCF